MYNTTYSIDNNFPDERRADLQHEWNFIHDYFGHFEHDLDQCLNITGECTWDTMPITNYTQLQESIRFLRRKLLDFSKDLGGSFI